MRTVGCLQLRKLGLRLGMVLVEVKGRFEGEDSKRKAGNTKTNRADCPVIYSSGLRKCHWAVSSLAS